MRTSAGRLVSVAALLLLFVATAIVVSQHAKTAHKGELYSAQGVKELLVEHASSGGQGACIRVEMASCPNALNSRGEPSPQMKIGCLIRGSVNDGLWAVGIVGIRYGLDNPVYVTGHVESTSAWRRECRRDQCGVGDITFLYRWFGPQGPIGQ